MIYVGGVPVSTDSESSSQGSDMLVALMEHPTLKSASCSLKDIPERKFNGSEESGSGRSRRSKCVYIFQREYATVDPALVDLVGTDEATTCVGLAIRNRTSGMYGDYYAADKNFSKTSVGHMDSPNIVDIGLAQMLTLVVEQNSNAELDVHLIGGFDDVKPQNASIGTRPESKGKKEGYSFPLCVKIVEALEKSGERFHINTFHVLRHNTRWDSQGNACPVFHGFMVETSTGSLIPTAFDRTSRCPDEIVRRVRLTASSEDPRWKGKLIETYETQTDRFIIAPCSWTRHLVYFASMVRQLSDAEILNSCSTSPFAEGPDFVDNERRLCDYLIRHPDWRETFPMNQPRIFERTADGTWIRQGVKLSPD